MTAHESLRSRPENLITPEVDSVGTSHIALWIESGELIKTVFNHPLLSGPQTCVRGKNGGPNTFAWSSGVRALTALFLRSASTRELDTRAVLIGDQQSVASTLDYSLAKKPAWLCDMFGVESSGSPLATRLFIRTNPERKRPGPVEIALRRAMTVHVWVDGRRITEPHSLRVLADSMEASLLQELSTKVLRLKIARPPTHNREAAALNGDSHFQPVIAAQSPALVGFIAQQARLGELPIPFSHPVVHARLVSLFEEELAFSLQHRDVFGPRGQGLAWSRLQRDSTFIKAARNLDEVLNAFASNLHLGEQLGSARDSDQLRRAAATHGPISFAVPGDLTGAVAILFYMKYVKGYPIEIEYNFVHSPQILGLIETGNLPPHLDAVILSAHPAAVLASTGKQRGFMPLMLMPRITRRVLSARNFGKDPRKGRFFGLRGTPATSSSYIDSLIEAGGIDKSGSKFERAEPYEQAAVLAEGDPDARAVLVFPHYNFHALFNDCVVHDFGLADMGSVSTAAFVSSALDANKNLRSALEIAIRDAWLDLSESRGLRREIGCMLAADRGYIKFMKRAGGLDRIMEKWFAQSSSDEEVMSALARQVGRV